MKEIQTELGISDISTRHICAEQ